MRIHKAIENIQAAIDRHQDEWLKDNGYEPEEHIRRTPSEPEPPRKASQAGQLSANRFLGGVKPEPEIQEEQAEIIPVIKQKEEHHSWLYNEVVKAVNDAAKNHKGTKVIAVFIPVVRSGEEFNDLPVAETITLPPVYDENVHVEELPPFKEFLDETEPEPEQEAEAEELEAVESEPEPVPEEDIESAEPEALDEDITLSEPEEELEPVIAEEILPEPEPEPEAVGDILSSEPENPEELQEIFRDMEEKLEEPSQPEQEEQEEQEEPDEKFTDDLVDSVMGESLDAEDSPELEELEQDSEAQPMTFTEIMPVQESSEEVPDDDDKDFDDIELLPDIEQE